MLLLAFVLALRHSGASTTAPAEGESLSPRNPQPATRATPILEAIVDEPGADSAPPTVRSPLPQAAPLDPLAALLAAFEPEADPDRRSAGLERAAASVSQADLPAALNALSANTSLAADELRQALARRWAESQPGAAAAAWVAQLPEGPTCRDLAQQVAIAWANSDLAAAAHWVNSLPDGGVKSAAVLGFGYEAARADPMTALAVAAALPASPDRDEMLIHAASQWAATDPAAAMAWASQAADSRLRQRLLAAVALASAKQDPATAAGLAATAVDPGPEQDRTAVAIVQRWAQTSPEAAAAWVAQFPDT